MFQFGAFGSTVGVLKFEEMEGAANVHVLAVYGSA